MALIIGNGRYQHVRPLDNPPNDAAAMAKLFNDAGFATVETRTDLDQRALLHALADFEVLARDAEVAIVYYSGHGLEFGGRLEIILAINSVLWSPVTSDFSGFQVGGI